MFSKPNLGTFPQPSFTPLGWLKRGVFTFLVEFVAFEPVVVTAVEWNTQNFLPQVLLILCKLKNIYFSLYLK